MKLPLHGKGDIAIHRQLMFSATNGRGFRQNFMEQTMVQLGVAPASHFKKEQSERQKRKAQLREAYWAGVEAHGV